MLTEQRILRTCLVLECFHFCATDVLYKFFFCLDLYRDPTIKVKRLKFFLHFLRSKLKTETCQNICILCIKTRAVFHWFRQWKHVRWKILLQFNCTSNFLFLPFIRYGHGIEIEEKLKRILFLWIKKQIRWKIKVR